MNIYQTHPVRSKHSLCWQEEYLIGLLATTNEPVPTTEVLSQAKEAMVLATSHKYLTQIIDKKYAETVVANNDKRFTLVRLTARGFGYLEELEQCK